MQLLTKNIMSILLCGLVLTGCAPAYTNQGVNSVAESLPMTEVDTGNRLMSICNSVISSSAMLSSSLMKYTQELVDSTVQDKETLIQYIVLHIDTVKDAYADLNAMRPAQSHEQRTMDIKTTLKNLEENLRLLQKAVEEDNFEEIATYYDIIEDNWNTLKTLSVGM